MTRKKFEKKLVLNKITISNMNESGMMAIQAGATPTIDVAVCYTDRDCKTNEQGYCPSVQGCDNWACYAC